MPSYADKRRVTHLVCTTIQEVATKEGIDMPLPTYALDTVVIHEEGARASPGPATSQSSNADD